MMAIRAIRAFGDIGAAGAQQYVIVFTQYHTLCTISCNTHDIQLFYICVCVWASSLDWPWTSGAPGLPHNYHHAHDRLLDGEEHHQNHHQLVLFWFSAFYVKVLISQFNATKHQSPSSHSGSMQQYQCILETPLSHSPHMCSIAMWGRHVINISDRISSVIVKIII